MQALTNISIAVTAVIDLVVDVAVGDEKTFLVREEKLSLQY